MEGDGRTDRTPGRGRAADDALPPTGTECFLYTCPAGRGVDVTLRKARDMSIIPHYIRWRDEIRFKVLNGRKLRRSRWVCKGVSRMFEDYDRWELVT